MLRVLIFMLIAVNHLLCLIYKSNNYHIFICKASIAIQFQASTRVGSYILQRIAQISAHRDCLPINFLENTNNKTWL